MSWDRRSGGRSSDPEAISVATLVKARGAALLDALELHLPGARDHADGTASYAFATAAELGLDREHAEAVREAAACQWIAGTAERFEGGGPGGLSGEDIPLEARIIRVACECDGALATPLPPGWTEGPTAVAIERLRGAAGSELDPRVVDALAGVLGRVAAT